MKNLVRSLVISIFLFFLVPQISQSCTTFFFNHNGHTVFGKNYDWHIERGLVFINKRGVSKSPRGDKEFVKDPGPFAHWTSKYGSLTFNQYGREFPMGGINEAGLVVEIMALMSTKYPTPDDRPAVTLLQWIQYQLDNFSKVEQVIASDSQIRIYNTGELGTHYLVADKEGNCATIEFINGKMVYHTRETLPIKVLANSTYSESMEYLKRHKGFGGDQSVSDSSGSYGINSLNRFVRAANMLKNYNPNIQASSVDYAFNILDNVAQSILEFRTQWSIVYDIQKLRIYFRTFSNKQIRYMDLHSFDFSCLTPVKVLDMNLDGSGDMKDNFLDYTREMNLDLIQHSWKEFNMPDSFLERLSTYPERTRCD